MKNLIIFAFIALFSFSISFTATAETGGYCNKNFYYKTVKNGDVYSVGKDVYVRVDAQKYRDVKEMTLYINGYKIRTEMNAPYEWARPHSNGDHYLRNMRAGTYKLKCVVKTKCGGQYKKEIIFHVKNRPHGYCNTNYWYEYAKHGSSCKAGKDLYVKVKAQKHRDVEYMELYINGKKVRREMNAPYEWGRPHGGGDHYLRNMKRGTYNLKCKIKTRCGEIIWKKSTVYVKG
jgi:hypothetical protein